MRFLLLFLVIAMAAGVLAQGKAFEYPSNGETMEGYVSLPSGAGKRPVVLIIHDWNGLDGYEQTRANMIAQLGYVGFSIDVYGKSVRPKSQADNAREAGKYYQNPDLFRKRIADAIQAVGSIPRADADKVAVMGYCFGGRAALEAARMGADIKGAISFHGSLTTDTKAAKGKVKAKVMVFHATQDPAVPRDQFNGFLDEMRDAEVDYQIVCYNLAVHPFTVIGGPQYNAEADRRSWNGLKSFLADLFK